jgi:hypothetical protein
MGSGEWIKMKRADAFSSSLSRSDLANYEDRESVWREFERLGEEEVRLRIQFHVYDEQTSECARDWLAEREVINYGDDIRSVRAVARKANDAASAAYKIGQSAHSLAQDADSAVKCVQDRANRAVAIAEGAARESRACLSMSSLALLSAAVALAVSIGGVLFR